MPFLSQNLDFQRHICLGLFTLNGLRWEVLVRFVDIGWIVDHHCLNFILYVQWLEVRGACSFCLYRWNCWPSLFKLSFHNQTYDIINTCIRYSTIETKFFSFNGNVSNLYNNDVIYKKLKSREYSFVCEQVYLIFLLQHW